MESILEDLYDGNINPSEDYKYSCIQYERLLKDKNEKENKFLDKLDEEMQNEFYEILDSWCDIYPLEIKDIFLSGFKMGARLSLEIYED